MNEMRQIIAETDQETLVQLVVDALRRTVVHYGHWFAQVEHQLGMEKALAVEEDVWRASLANQVQRLGKTLDFPVENGIPAVLNSFSKETLIDLLEKLGVNWLANDGIWFQAVERRFGMNDAKRCNDSVWGQFSPLEAWSIKRLLNLPERPGLEGLRQALNFRIYAQINTQSTVEDGADGIIFRMNECRVQSARKRKGLDDYPCKTAGLVEYTYFARSIDDRIRTECLGCPPDPHPDDWYCAWRFTIKE